MYGQKDLIIQCCVCKRIRKEHEGYLYWVKENLEKWDLVSHGYCPDCATEERKRIKIIKDINEATSMVNKWLVTLNS